MPCWLWPPDDNVGKASPTLPRGDGTLCVDVVLGVARRRCHVVFGDWLGVSLEQHDDEGWVTHVRYRGESNAGKSWIDGSGRLINANADACVRWLFHAPAQHPLLVAVAVASLKVANVANIRA